MQEDGLHPNAAAEPIVLDTLWPYLKPLISNAPRTEGH
jgi:acyl-CoA thioesterase-1